MEMPAKDAWSEPDQAKQHLGVPDRAAAVARAQRLRSHRDKALTFGDDTAKIY